MHLRIVWLAAVLLCLGACERERPPELAADSTHTAPATASGEPRATDTPPPTIVAPGGTFRLTDGKIVIAVINDQSGAYAEFGGKNAVEAVRMAVEDFEGRYGKGVFGAPLEVVSADHQDDPDKAAARAQEAIERNAADLLLDVPTSAAAMRVMQVAAEKRRVYINVSAATVDLTGKDCNRYTFHYAYDTSLLAGVAGTWATQNVGKRWHLVYPKVAFGQELESAFRKAIEA